MSSTDSGVVGVVIVVRRLVKLRNQSEIADDIGDTRTRIRVGPAKCSASPSIASPRVFLDVVLPETHHVGRRLREFAARELLPHEEPNGDAERRFRFHRYGVERRLLTLNFEAPRRGS